MGNFVKDTIVLCNEEVKGQPLLIKVMEKGAIVYELPSLADIRKTASANLSKLPDKYKRLKETPRYLVEKSPKLKK